MRLNGTKKNWAKEVNIGICAIDDANQLISSLFPSRELNKFSV